MGLRVAIGLGDTKDVHCDPWGRLIARFSTGEPQRVTLSDKRNAVPALGGVNRLTP